MGKAWSRTLVLALLLLVCVAAFNASWLTPIPDDDIKILSHRGVHQTYHRENLTNDTCTAERIFEPTHSFLENTLPSMKAAFDFGADMVEVDIHQTRDGEFAVFHDWTLECRTDGTGRTADHSMAALRRLDLGYGYTADGGRTYPLRGKGVGMMPTLADVLNAFPSGAFMINLKSDRADHANALHAYLGKLGRPTSTREVMLVTGPRVAARWRQLETDIAVTTKAEAMRCLRDYLLLGWFGRIPQACRRSGVLGVPEDMTWLIWGWPRQTVARFHQAGLKVMLVGPLNGPTNYVDTLEQAQNVPHDYRGWVVTNRIELTGSVLENR